MTQQTINLGTNPNDGTGDALRVGGTKINANFTDLYTTSYATNVVNSFNTRKGAVSLTSSDVTNALTYTPYNAAGGSISGAAVINSTTNSTSTGTGALIVAGGAGIAGSMFVGGTINGNLTGNVTGNINGGLTSSSVALTGGTIDGTAIGSTTPAAGAFTTLSGSGNDVLLYTNTSGQTISASTATTITGWTKTFDRLNANFVASTGIFTAPATGFYEVDVQLVYSSLAATGVNNSFEVLIIANSVTVATGITYSQQTTTATAISVQANAVVSLTSGQTIKIQAYQTNTGSRTLSTTATLNYLTINRVP